MELYRMARADRPADGRRSDADSAGEPYDWLKETHAICVGIYEDSPDGTKISYDYVYKYTPVIELQFLRGGYRLARLLNEIYR